MAWKTVESYRLGFKIATKEFLFYYSFRGDSNVYQMSPGPNAQEFLALADMFRNEGPISFNTVGGYFISGAEKPGEEESHP